MGLGDRTPPVLRGGLRLLGCNGDGGVQGGCGESWSCPGSIPADPSMDQSSPPRTWWSITGHPKSSQGPPQDIMGHPGPRDKAETPPLGNRGDPPAPGGTPWVRLSPFARCWGLGGGAGAKREKSGGRAPTIERGQVNRHRAGGGPRPPHGCVGTADPGDIPLGDSPWGHPLRGDGPRRHLLCDTPGPLAPEDPGGGALGHLLHPLRPCCMAGEGGRLSGQPSPREPLCPRR